MPSSQLTKKQSLFAAYYVSEGFNATKAAKRAGYAESSAHSQGHDLLKKPEISAAIRDEVVRLSKTARLDAESIWSSLSLAVSRYLDYVLKTPVEDQDASKVNVFARLIELTGKHNDVQAFKERIDLNVNAEHDEIMERAIQRRERDSKEKNLH